MEIYHKSPFDSNTYSYGKKDVVHLKHLVSVLRDSINSQLPMYLTPSQGQSSTSNWASNNNNIMYSLDPYQATLIDYDKCDGLNYDLYFVVMIRAEEYVKLEFELDDDDIIAYEVSNEDVAKRWTYVYKLGSYRQHNFRRSMRKLYV